MPSLCQVPFAMLLVGVENLIDEVEWIGDAKGVVALGEHGVDMFRERGLQVKL